MQCKKCGHVELDKGYSGNDAGVNERINVLDEIISLAKSKMGDDLSPEMIQIELTKKGDK